jgi:uncharacterized alkaline shock family protein YloU
MSVIVRNDYGAIAVNKGVIEKMIVEDLLEMSDRIILCNKKGKQIKENPTPLLDPDYYDAVEVSDKKNFVKVRVYVIAHFGYSIPGLAEAIFDRIESDFRLLRLDMPARISVNVKGVMAGILVKRNIEIVRKHS